MSNITSINCPIYSSSIEKGRPGSSPLESETRWRHSVIVSQRASSEMANYSLFEKDHLSFFLRLLYLSKDTIVKIARPISLASFPPTSMIKIAFLYLRPLYIHYDAYKTRPGNTVSG